MFGLWVSGHGHHHSEWLQALPAATDKHPETPFCRPVPVTKLPRKSQLIVLFIYFHIENPVRASAGLSVSTLPRWTRYRGFIGCGDRDSRSRCNNH
jgi:hypothetical protein